MPYDGSKRHADEYWRFVRPAWFSRAPAQNGVCRCSDPDDACNAKAALAWLQFSDVYQWPHIEYFDSVAQLHQKAHALLVNTSRRHLISRAMRDYFSAERARTERLVRHALQQRMIHFRNSTREEGF